jgi:uncharacterized protein
VKCPHCKDTVLVMSERQGVEIDHCPQCRGVWLDRGELDKLIERSAAMTPPSAPNPAAHRGTAAQGHPTGFVDSDYKHGRSVHGGKRRSWLNSIFD